MSPGDMGRLAVTQAPVEDHQPTLWWNVVKGGKYHYYYYYYYYHTPWKFFTPALIIQWNLIDDYFPPLSRTLLSILTHLSYALIWIVSILPLISISSSLSYNLFWTVPSVLITVDIIVTLVFHCFLVLWQGPSVCVYFCFHLLSLCCPLELHRYGNFSFFLSVIPTSLLFCPTLSDPLHLKIFFV